MELKQIKQLNSIQIYRLCDELQAKAIRIMFMKLR